MTDPLYNVGSTYDNNGTDIVGSWSSNSQGRDDYGIKWKNGQDLLDTTIGPDDFRRERPRSSSPSSSMLEQPMGPPRGEPQTPASSNWNVRSPSGIQHRPDFPYSTALLWDFFEAQSSFLKIRSGELSRPPELAEYELPKFLPELSPVLLVRDELLVKERSDAFAIFDCLTSKGVVSKKSHFVVTAPQAAELEGWLDAYLIDLSDNKVMRLEWLLGILYDLKQFSKTQFDMIHEQVPSKYWLSAYRTEYSWFWDQLGYATFGVDKPRSKKRHLFSERLHYWDRVRKTEHENRPSSSIAPSEPQPVASSAPTVALARPREFSASELASLV